MAQKNFQAMAQTHIWHADFNLISEAKMTKYDIQNPKLIDPNDNQPFYIRILHFFWVSLTLIWKSWYFSFKRSSHKNRHF